MKIIDGFKFGVGFILGIEVVSFVENLLNQYKGDNKDEKDQPNEEVETETEN